MEHTELKPVNGNPDTSRMTAPCGLTKQEQFFYDHASFSYMQGEDAEVGHVRSAKAYAAAETFARDENWLYEWEMERENPVDVFGAPDEVNGPFYDPTNDFVSCLLRAEDGTILASLGMIEESKDNRERANYRRVVEAELALEAMPEVL